MLISQEVPCKWNSKNKAKYEELGYEYSGIGNEFMVRVADLSRGSKTRVTVLCDYCGSEFTKTYDWYNKARKIIDKDCCSNPKCTAAKSQDSLIKKYGVSNIRSISGVNEKIKNTNIEKYGVENPFASELIKEKIRNTNIAKLGVPYPTMSAEVIDRQKKTCTDKYGVPCYLNLNYAGEQNSGINHPRWRGGVVRGERNGYHAGEYKIWRDQVFAQNGYTCQCCGANTGNGHTVILNAHHIYNWANYPEYRFEVSNGITLCEKCHKEFHKFYGKHDNSPEQIEEFLSHVKKIC